jgi:enamine deaminase RidA (YjgF/YER057c/UK114 family)
VSIAVLEEVRIHRRALVVSEQSLRALQQAPAHRRQLHAAGFALENLDPYCNIELLNSPAERELNNIQALGRAANDSRRSDLAELPKLTNLQRHDREPASFWYAGSALPTDAAASLASGSTARRSARSVLVEAGPDCRLYVVTAGFLGLESSSATPLTSKPNAKRDSMSDPLFINEDFPWRDGLPMCSMVKAGDFLWLSGITARDESGKLVGPNDIQAQARQIFTNMQRVLALAGRDLTSVIRLTNYLTTPMNDMEFTRKYWIVRQEFLGNHRPASTGVRVASLMMPEMLIEIDAVAYAPNATLSPKARILNA